MVRSHFRAHINSWAIRHSFPGQPWVDENRAILGLVHDGWPRTSRDVSSLTNCGQQAGAVRVVYGDLEKCCECSRHITTSKGVPAPNLLHPRNGKRSNIKAHGKRALCSTECQRKHKEHLICEGEFTTNGCRGTCMSLCGICVAVRRGVRVPSCACGKRQP